VSNGDSGFGPEERKEPIGIAGLEYDLDPRRRGGSTWLIAGRDAMGVVAGS